MSTPQPTCISEEMAYGITDVAGGKEGTDKVMVLLKNPHKDWEVKGAIFDNLYNIFKNFVFGRSGETSITEHVPDLSPEWYTTCNSPEDFKPGYFTGLCLISANDDTKYDEWIATGKEQGFRVVLVDVNITFEATVV